MTFLGHYDSHECKVQLRSVTLADTGRWTCEMEQYKWGDFVRGKRVSTKVHVLVRIQ